MEITFATVNGNSAMFLDLKYNTDTIHTFVLVLARHDI